MPTVIYGFAVYRIRYTDAPISSAFKRTQWGANAVS